ncbi:MAG: hypothetical protein O2854_03885 [Chloroflexi bacterium]|nr:hypothetical protein [Chloroflexota bacterium]
MSRPFQCSKCRNWYTPIPVSEEDYCWSCREGKHAPHHKTGVIDCHFGQTSSTPSEIKMVGIVATIKDAITAVEGGDIRSAEVAFALAEKARGEVTDVVRWATVMEMPGTLGESSTTRFKNIDALIALVADKRRPPEDLAMVRRTMRFCDEMAAEIPLLMADLRTNIGALRASVQGESKTEKKVAVAA